MNPDLPVSVVIPTLGREDYLRTVLEGLFVQTYTNFEIIVVDQSDQISPAIVELGRSSPRQFRLIHDTDKGLARARNIGLKHSEGKLFLGLEDDLKIVHNDLIRAHVEVYSDPTIGGTSGRVIEMKHTHYRGRVGGMHPLLCVPIGQGDGEQRQFIETVKGGNMSFLKDVLMRVGGFDERFGQPSIYEDTDVSLKIRRLGYRLLFVPEASVIHLSAPTGGERDKANPAHFRFVAYRDRVLLFRNNFHPWLYPVFLSANIVSAFRPIVKFDWRSAWLALSGLWSGLRRFGGRNVRR